VLFDEIEKAHHDVFNVLLQVLDDGRLTDGQGHTVDFRNTIIIMTSNLGSDLIAAADMSDEVGEAQVRDRVMDVVRRHFRPEFLNRLDEIILFHRLTRTDMAQIVDIQLARLRRMLDERKIRLELSESARAWLAEAGYDPVYGARPLKRVIQRNLQDPLATRLLEGRIKDGETVEIAARDGALVINGEEVKAEAA
jgi:ATP-dependent Clp protease ATP-binding subunit ClpB